MFKQKYLIIQVLSGLKRRVKSRSSADFQAAVSDPCVVPELRHERHVVSVFRLNNTAVFDAER